MFTLDAGTAPAEAAALAATKKKSAPQQTLYTTEEREHFQQLARSGGVKSVVARKRLDNDASRREDARLSAEAPTRFAAPALEVTDAGYAGRGGGRMGHVRRPQQFRETTTQIAGFYPFSVGANAPLSGAPIGTHLETGQPVGFDAMSWFLDGELTAPSVMCIGLNGFGKSTFGRRVALYDLAVGVRPIIMGDLKPDFTPMFDAINNLSRNEYGGRDPLQVSQVGWGSGKINPLAVGSFGKIIARLPAAARSSAEVELRRRQVTALVALLEILGGKAFEPHESNLVEEALNTLYRTSNEFGLDNPPLPQNVLAVIQQAPDHYLKAVASKGLVPELIAASGSLGRTADITYDRYVELTEHLRQCLDLIVRGPFGQMFNHQTTHPVDTDSLGVCVDISKVPAGDTKLRAATLLTCWSDGFSAVEATHLLSDHGLAAPRLFDLFVDEFSLVLGTGHGIVYRVDEITRVQRTIGTGTMFTTHTIKDLAAFDSMEDRNRAMGFFDRARAKVFFPLPRAEAELLEGKVALNEHEIASLAEWASAARSADDAVVAQTTPQQWAAGVRPAGRDRTRRVPPGMGKCLIKTGEGDQPGIPVQMHLTPTERRLGFHNTNRRFDSAFGTQLDQLRV